MQLAVLATNKLAKIKNKCITLTVIIAKLKIYIKRMDSMQILIALHISRSSR